MIRYSYQSQIRPPAPFVHVTLRNPQTGQALADIPAQLDTAADRTLLPESLTTALSLARTGTITIGGVGGTVQAMALHPVEVAIHDLHGRVIEAVASTGENWILLGRDMLNGHRVILDGPRLIVEIE